MMKLVLMVGIAYWLFVTGCSEGFLIENGKPAIVHLRGGDRKVRYIPGADAATFKSLDNAKDARATYAIDAKRVYMGYWGNAMAIEMADPVTFKILTSTGTYTADKDRIYWFGVELEGADPATFRIIEQPYAIDANQAYAGITSFTVHSLENFEVLQTRDISSPITNRGNQTVIKDRDKICISGWSRDGIAYYWSGIELKGADYDSLAILNDCHAKDKKTVYFYGKPIRSADAESFVIVGPGSVRGRDKKYEYKLGKRVGRRKPLNGK